MHLERQRPDTGKPSRDDIVCAAIFIVWLVAAFNVPAICRFFGLFQ